MIAQIRTYTINTGMMKSWIEIFQNEIINVSQLYNINVVKIIKDPINHLVDFHVI